MKKILVFALVLSFMQICANEKEQQQIDALNALTKSMHHYIVLRAYVLAKKAEGQEVSQDRISQLGTDLHDVYKKLIVYIDVTKKQDRDKRLLEDVNEGLRNGNDLIEVIDRAELVKNAS